MTHHARHASRHPGLLTYVAAAFAVGVIGNFVSYVNRAGRGEPAPDVVDLAGEESFPASDPPPWTSGRDRNAEM